MKRPKRSRKTGNLIFFIPTVVILAIVVFGLTTVFRAQTGTLVVYGESSGTYSASVTLHPLVEVGGVTKASPYNFTLPQGDYTVVYGAVQWYVTPPSRTVAVINGKLQYAIGTYDPVVRNITITNRGFNETSVTVLHGVTPVVWLNDGTTAVLLDIESLTGVTVSPGQSFTYVFQATGSFTFRIQGTSYSGSVDSL